MKLNFSKTGGIGLPIASGTRTISEKDAKGSYIPCSGNGIAIKTEDKYLETLAKLAADSPTHGGAIQRKAVLTLGQGFNLDELPKDIKEWFDLINEQGDTANDILERACWDYAIYKGVALAVTWTGSKTIAEIRHVPFKNVRIGTPINNKIPYYIINNDWQQELDRKFRVVEKLLPFNPDKINEGVIEDGNLKVDETTAENAEQLIYYCGYSASSDGFYPVPDYANCLDAALTEVDTGIAIHNSTKNGINGAYIVSAAEGTVMDDTSKQQVTDSLSKHISGPENSGSILFIPTGVKVDKLDAISHDTYIHTNEEMKQRIVTAHNIPAILLEIQTSGGFNSRADEMNEAINIFQKTTILGYQQKIVRVFKSILKYRTKQEVDLKIIPFSLLDSDTKATGDTNINS